QAIAVKVLPRDQADSLIHWRPAGIPVPNLPGRHGQELLQRGLEAPRDLRQAASIGYRDTLLQIQPIRRVVCCSAIEEDRHDLVRSSGATRHLNRPRYLSP